MPKVTQFIQIDLENPIIAGIKCNLRKNIRDASFLGKEPLQKI